MLSAVGRLLKIKTGRRSGRYAASCFANSCLNEIAAGSIIYDVSEETTQNLENGDLRRILERLDSIDSRLNSLEQKADARSYETKPIWEQALKEIAETRVEMRAGFEKMDARFEMLEQKLEVLTDDVLTVRAKHKNLDARVRNLESEPAQ